MQQGTHKGWRHDVGCSRWPRSLSWAWLRSLVTCLCASCGAEGLKLRPNHPRRSIEAIGGHRRFTALPQRWGVPLRRAAQVSVSGGEPVQVQTPSATMYPLSISPDESELLIVDQQGTTFTGPLWSLPVLGGSPRRLGDTIGRQAAWSLDYKMLAYANGSSLFLASSDGTEPRKLTSVTGLALAPAWSPDGSKLRLTVQDPKTGLQSLWEVSAQGTNLRPCLPAGTILPTNAAANGRRRESISSSSRRARSGLFPKKEVFFGSAAARLYS